VTFPAPRLLGHIAAATLAACTLVGCGASEPVTTSGPAAGGEGATSYPLTIDNCGRSQTFDAAPGRVVSLDQGSTEILLSLGLGDRMVGTASWTDPVRENLAEANALVPRLSDNAPSYEAALGTDPDFVTASFGGTSRAKAASRRATGSPRPASGPTSRPPTVRTGAASTPAASGPGR
jgi:iron complex transport system substrate-binding protein